MFHYHETLVISLFPWIFAWVYPRISALETFLSPNHTNEKNKDIDATDKSAIRLRLTNKPSPLIIVTLQDRHKSKKIGVISTNRYCQFQMSGTRLVYGDGLDDLKDCFTGTFGLGRGGQRWTVSPK